ncbi:hypothetical protein H4R19_004963, partial [Coemansia spiralis]
MAGDSGAGTALSSHNARSQRDDNNKLRVGRRGGSKSLRHSTPRTSSVSSRRSSGPDMSEQRARLARLEKEAVSKPSSKPASKPASEAKGGSEPAVPFRVKFVNHQNEATMRDVLRTDKFEEIVPSVAEKLRMPPKATYLLIYKDTDDEEIGVGCTDNMQEMLALFEPGSRIQLRIVPYNIINHGALETISGFWGYASTPNVFMSEAGDAPGDSDSSSDSDAGSKGSNGSDDGDEDGDIAHINLDDIIAESAKKEKIKQEM